MQKRKVVKKRTNKRKLAHGKKAAIGSRKMQNRNQPTGRKKRRHAQSHRVQPRVWRRAARLAQDALAALDAGNLAQVRQYLQSIRAVAECADEV